MLINILERVKNQTGLDNVTYKSMYTTGCVPTDEVLLLFVCKCSYSLKQSM